MDKKVQTTTTLTKDIQNLITNSQETAIKAVNT